MRPHFLFMLIVAAATRAAPPSQAIAPVRGDGELSNCDREELDDALRRAEHWRRVAGDLLCNATGKGPTGGFCTPDSQNAGCLPSEMAKKLAQLFHGKSVLDLGCGLGEYGKYFNEHDSSVQWMGLDGGEGVEEWTDGHVKFADLSEGLPGFARKKWDWTMSIEVAEHLPQWAEPSFLHNLLLWATDGVVLSWAAVGQIGRDHINCQSREYIQCAMSLLGWRVDDVAGEALRTAAKTEGNCWWLANTVQLFYPNASSAAQELYPLPSVANDDFKEAYMRLTRERCSPAPPNACGPHRQQQEQ